MKKIIFSVLNFIFIILVIRSTIAETNKININNYLENYFKTKSYTIFEEKVIVGNKMFIVAVKYIKIIKGKYDKFETKILDKAIVFEIKNDKIISHLYVEKEKILDKNRKLLVDLKDQSKQNLIFYGWSFGGITMPFKGFNFWGRFNEGRDVGDPPFLIEWNTKIKTFYYREILL